MPFSSRILPAAGEGNHGESEKMVFGQFKISQATRTASLAGETLTLRGEKRFEKEECEQSYHRIERAYGDFVRTFTLPRSIDPEAISAKYDRGVLELTMPKRNETKPRQIRIEIKE